MQLDNKLLILVRLSVKYMNQNSGHNVSADTQVYANASLNNIRPHMQQAQAYNVSCIASLMGKFQIKYRSRNSRL